MTPKHDSPRAATGFTIDRMSNCGKIYTTVTMFPSGELMKILVTFGKAGGCGSAMANGVAELMSYGLRSGLDPHDLVKALSGIGCHLGPNTCLNVIAESVAFVIRHLETGQDINELIEEHDLSEANMAINQ